MEGKMIVKYKFGAAANLLLVTLAGAVFVHTVDVMNKMNERSRHEKELKTVTDGLKQCKELLDRVNAAKENIGEKEEEES